MKLAKSIDEYKVYQSVGRGGFAEVYRAIELETGTQVAIKKINKHLMQQKNMGHRVQQEIEIHSTLNHPSIVEMYGYFMDDDYIYLVLEFCPDGDLRKFLDTRHSPFDEEQAKFILKQVLAGLCYLHSNKIIHRDVTLSNLMLTKDFTIVKIADFGLAVKLSKSGDKHKTMCGTPNYIAPEVITRQNQGLDTDIWNVGVLLYTLLVGRAPFDIDSGDGRTTLLQRVVTCEVSWPKFLSSEVIHLMELMLKKDPKERIKLSGILSHPFMTGSNQQVSRSSTGGMSGSLNDESGVGTASQSWSTPNGNSCSSVPSLMRDEFPSARTQLSPLTINAVKLVEHQQTAATHQPSRHSAACSHTTSKQCFQCSHVETCSCCLLQHLAVGRRTTNKDNSGHVNGITFQNQKTNQTETHATSKSYQSSTRYAEIVRILKPNTAVPPLNTTRLQPMRHSKNKNVIYTILDTGDVCMELLKVINQVVNTVEVLHISSDGLKIIIHRPNVLPDNNKPPPLPQCGVSVYTYESLPEKHLHKYHHAALFVNLVKESTPKIVYFSPSGKCKLMENKPDSNFHMEFYDGMKIEKNNAKVKIMTCKNNQVISEHHINFDGNGLGQPLRSVWEHFKSCLDQCIERENYLEELSLKSGINWFPNTIGWRPTVITPRSQIGENVQQNNKENLQPAPSHIANRAPSQPSSIVSRASKLTTSSSRSTVIKQVDIPGSGKAFHMANGLISIQFVDDTKLDVQPMMSSHKLPQFMYTNKNGSKQEYHSDMHTYYPQEVLEKLALFREVYLKLMKL